MKDKLHFFVFLLHYCCAPLYFLLRFGVRLIPGEARPVLGSLRHRRFLEDMGKCVFSNRLG